MHEKRDNAELEPIDELVRAAADVLDRAAEVADESQRLAAEARRLREELRRSGDGNPEE